MITTQPTPISLSLCPQYMYTLLGFWNCGCGGCGYGFWWLTLRETIPRFLCSGVNSDIYYAVMPPIPSPHGKPDRDVIKFAQTHSVVLVVKYAQDSSLDAFLHRQ